MEWVRSASVGTLVCRYELDQVTHARRSMKRPTMRLPLVDRLEQLLFWRQTVGVTGDGPYEAVAIEKIITLEGGLVGGREAWQPYQLMVVGRENFDREYLKESIKKLYLQNGTPCEYVSQEDFWQAWLYRESMVHRPYFRGDPRITDHPGLRMLATLGFRWPVPQEAPAAGEGTGGLSDRLRAMSDLRRTFGYGVGKNTTLEDRRRNLRRAIKPPPFGLGLRVVAEHIAGLISLQGSRHDPPLEAIEKWRADLKWLEENHYEVELESFVWPGLDLPESVLRRTEER